MEELKTILQGVKFADGSNLSDGIIEEIKAAINKAGYIKLPGNAQNVTITTSDNPADGKLMTEQEWREKFGGN